jgi:hypothetical protein
MGGVVMRVEVESGWVGDGAGVMEGPQASRTKSKAVNGSRRRFICGGPFTYEIGRKRSSLFIENTQHHL